MSKTMKNEKKRRVPRLRFPEFRDAGEWEGKKLSDKGVSIFEKKRVTLNDLDIDTYVSTENILPDFGGIATASKLPPSGSFTAYKSGDILIANIRPYLKKIWVADKSGAASNDVVVVRPMVKAKNLFLASLLKNEVFIAYIMKGAKGVKMPRGDISLMKEYPVALPGPEEQQKIADCLSSLDALITAQAEKLDALKIHKKGLMQQLFPREGETVPRLRFPEFRDAGEWLHRILKEFISERSEFPEGKVPLYSLTIEDGVAPKTDRYERAFLVKNEAKAYKIVQPNDFAYNPMNLRFGAIARYSGEETVAVSRYYNIFHCDDSVDSRFCEFYFSSPGMIAHYDNVATGSLIEKRRVHFSDFVQFCIRFPPLSEQQKIADCLSPLDALIAAHTEKLDALKTHKKGLMQQLFPSPEAVGA